MATRLLTNSNEKNACFGMVGQKNENILEGYVFGGFVKVVSQLCLIGAVRRQYEPVSPVRLSRKVSFFTAMRIRFPDGS
jgi:hypothetical protein